MYLYTWLLDSITPTILVLIRPALLGCLISLTFSMKIRLGMWMIMRMTLILEPSHLVSHAVHHLLEPLSQVWQGAGIVDKENLGKEVGG